MKREQEPKYNASVDGRIVNRASGEAIPDDEPVFIFRARDKHAAAVLIFYRDLCEDANHKAAIQSRWEDFMRFWRESPERMKEPDTAAQEPRT